MSTRSISESGMTFGPYPEGQCFHIEESKRYAAIQEHVQMAEFLLLRNHGDKPVIWVVEAKSSTPRPETQPNFEDFIAETREKFINAFSLGWACFSKRHPDAEKDVPDDFKTLDLSEVDVKFVLVINGHRDGWLSPIKDALEIALRSTVKCWAFNPNAVVVINDALAQEYGLILSGQGGSA